MRPLLPNEPVAIAVPTRNRPNYLAALLTSLVYQSYSRWSLVINDSSDTPVVEVSALADLLTLIESQGHAVTVLRTSSGWDRHQRSMEKVAAAVDLIVRVDDDVIFTPTYLDSVLKPFYFFPNRPLAAVGGSAPEGHYPVMDLDLQLMQPGWTPTPMEPTWRLQGHWYRQNEVLEVESLLGHSIAYRRSAVEAVGGWAIPGYSNQAHREESDLCMRLRAARYELMVTTEALAWHLYSPGGGSRTVRKGPDGVFLSESDKTPIAADEALFRQRQQGLDLPPERPLQRYRIVDLERRIHRPQPLQTWVGRAKQQRRTLLQWIKKLIALVR